KFLNKAEAAGKFPPRLAMKDLMDKRTELSNAWADATHGANPDLNHARILGNAVRSFDKMMDDLPLGEGYRALRADYHQNFIQRFENDTAFRTTQTNGRGFFQTHEENMAGLSIAKDNQSGLTKAQQFRNAFGTDAVSSAAMHDAIHDDFYGAAIKNGVV